MPPGSYFEANRGNVQNKRPEASSALSRGRLGAILGAGTKNGQNARRLPAILGAGLRNAENEPPEMPWEPLCEQGPEILERSLQRRPVDAPSSRLENNRNGK